MEKTMIEELTKEIKAQNKINAMHIAILLEIPRNLSLSEDERFSLVKGKAEDIMKEIYEE